jgi:hypothetical protein
MERRFSLDICYRESPGFKNEYGEKVLVKYLLPRIPGLTNEDQCKGTLWRDFEKDQAIAASIN